jgi:hypothetical protein
MDIMIHLKININKLILKKLIKLEHWIHKNRKINININMEKIEIYLILNMLKNHHRNIIVILRRNRNRNRDNIIIQYLKRRDNYSINHHITEYNMVNITKEIHTPIMIKTKVKFYQVILM